MLFEIYKCECGHYKTIHHWTRNVVISKTAKKSFYG
jgi:hypothetical protein